MFILKEFYWFNGQNPISYANQNNTIHVHHSSERLQVPNQGHNCCAKFVQSFQNYSIFLCVSVLSFPPGRNVQNQCNLSLRKITTCLIKKPNQRSTTAIHSIPEEQVSSCSRISTDFAIHEKTLSVTIIQKLIISFRYKGRIGFPLNIKEGTHGKAKSAVERQEGKTQWF